MDILNFILIKNIEEEQKKYSLILKRLLRDNKDAFNISDAAFIDLYRIPKHLVFNIINEIEDFIYVSNYRNGIPIHQKVLCALRFYANGSYQRSVGEEALIAMSQTCISNNIYEVSLALNKLLQKYIKFPKTNEEKNRIKQRYDLRFICIVVFQIF